LETVASKECKNTTHEIGAVSFTNTQAFIGIKCFLIFAVTVFDGGVGACAMGTMAHMASPGLNHICTLREEEEENLFAKKARCQKGLQPIDAGYHTHNKTKIDQINTNITC